MLAKNKILTMLWAATHYPEADLLHSLKSHAIVKALIKFYSNFGPPLHIQSDQRSSFMLKVFAQVMSELNVHFQHLMYHPEFQGTQGFHQMLSLCRVKLRMG